MFTGLVQMEPELHRILEESRMEKALLLKVALLLLEEPLPENWQGEGGKEESSRLPLTRQEFFRLMEKSIQNSVDPNLLLSYAFKEALLEILRL